MLEVTLLPANKSYYKQVELIMHPVIFRLLNVKWNMFGKRGAIRIFAINFFYTINWTVLGLLLPSKMRLYSLCFSRILPNRNSKWKG